MGKLDNIEAITDRLTASTIRVIPERCSYIRNWNSQCRRCMNVCPHDAITRSIGRFEIDQEACTDCGACVATCPTSAILTTAPDASEIVRQARLSAQANDGVACFICRRDAALSHIDTGKVVVLPCLNYLDEYLIIGLFACGVRRVALLRIDCEGCEVDGADPYFEQVVENASALMTSWQVPGNVTIEDDIPVSLQSTSRASGPVIASDRREAFAQAGGSMMELVTERIGAMVGEKKSSRPRQIIIDPDEVFPPDTYRSVRLLKMLDRIGTRPYGKYVSSRFWGDIEIDPVRCRACGNCARMCVTRALKYAQDESEGAKLTFRPSLCMGCRLCKNSCLTHAMVFSDRVLADSLDEDVVHTLYEGRATRSKGNPDKV